MIRLSAVTAGVTIAGLGNSIESLVGQVDQQSTVLEELLAQHSALNPLMNPPKDIEAFRSEVRTLKSQINEARSEYDRLIDLVVDDYMQLSGFAKSMDRGDFAAAESLEVCMAVIKSAALLSPILKSSGVFPPEFSQFLFSQLVLMERGPLMSLEDATQLICEQAEAYVPGDWSIEIPSSWENLEVLPSEWPTIRNHSAIQHEEESEDEIHFCPIHSAQMIGVVLGAMLNPDPRRH